MMRWTLYRPNYNLTAQFYDNLLIAVLLKFVVLSSFYSNVKYDAHVFRDR